MYTVQIYTPDFTTLLTTMFYGQDIYNFKYASEINKPGGAGFSVNVRNVKATPSNLTMFNKVIIARDNVEIFIGYIESIQASVNIIDVVCVGMLGFFNKRLATASYSSTVQDTVFSILTATNSLDDTGISIGTTDISQNLNNLELSRSTVLAAWQKLANLANGEIEITPAKELNFKQRLGTDNSANVLLKYVVTQINDSNLLDFEVEVQGKDMANQVTGIRDGGLTSTDSDATSIANYGLLEKAVNFSQTDNGTDLDSEVANYLDRHKIEFYAPKVVVNSERIDIANLNLGDTVRLKLDNGFMSLDINERIIKREVRVSDNLTEQLELGLMPETGNLLPSDFFNDIITLSNRVSLLESGI